MKRVVDFFKRKISGLNMGLRARLIVIFMLVKIIPLILITVLAWQQLTYLGAHLHSIAVKDSSDALNHIATENIERLTTETARQVAEFLYGRDGDILYLASLRPSEESYRAYIRARTGHVLKSGEWALSEDGLSWIQTDAAAETTREGVSTNSENDQQDGFLYRPPEIWVDNANYSDIPLYDEITFLNLDGQELIKVISENSPKIYYPMNPGLRDVSKRENTYVKAETYFPRLRELKPGEIYVSDVIGAYVGTNYIGMYTPGVLSGAPETHPNSQLLHEEGRLSGEAFLEAAGEQAYAGMENPDGRRFEGIIRWAAPVTDAAGAVIGYVTFALNHDHLMELVDHQTPMDERYTSMPSAFEGNYAFIWDYKCRSICHPRHHSIVGYDPQTGEPAVPWLESSIYDAWQERNAQYGDMPWTDFVADIPPFDNQSRSKKPAPQLTKAGSVGLDGRYLNNAPQCTGWMDISEDGGSGSFYILWSGLYKLTTVAAIPYYTGQYAPSEENNFSRRGFGFVTIGAGLDGFTRPATETAIRLDNAITSDQAKSALRIGLVAVVLVTLVVLVAILLASSLSKDITRLIAGISRFRAGERQFRFNAEKKDEFGTLADSFDDMADSIVDSVKNPLSITDMDLNIIYVNARGLELNNRKTLDEMIGKPYKSFSLYPEDTAYHPLWALEHGVEPEIYFLEDKALYLKGVANYFRGADGRKLGYIIESFDVTEMVRVQHALEKAVDDANRASAHKGEFLARMSHEIRTPMNAIIGLAGIVARRLAELNNPDFKDMRDNISQIETSSQHLLGLLNDILDITKIEAGKIDISEETVDLTKLANTVAGIIRPRCDEKNIAFITEFDNFPSAFVTDSLRLRQVLINLLGNSVKFTPELGHIEFKITARRSEPGVSRVGFSVRDTGIGMSPETLAIIFEPFEQGGAVNKKYGGTGLGLAISQRIVQRMGGGISVTSALGKGSEFRFELLLRETEARPDDDVVISDVSGRFRGRRLLLVDDVDINRMIVSEMLGETGAAIDETADGEAAVSAFSDSPEGAYDLILMDIKMPRMDGYEAARAIRALPRRDAASVPIIALTANAFKDDIDRALESGMNAHIAKPVERDALIETLLRFLG